MLKAIETIGIYFSRFVPERLRKYYFMLFKYGVFVSGGLVGWIILISSEQILLAYGFGRGIGFAVGLFLAIIFTFFYHRYVTFDVKTAWKERLLKFAPIQLIIAVANWILSILATEYMHFPDVQASFVITFALSIFNFIFTKILVFRHK